MTGDIESGYHRLDKPTTLWATIWVPRISLAVGLAAFSFQVVVLYPWHLELSEQFLELRLAVLNQTRV